MTEIEQLLTRVAAKARTAWHAEMNEELELAPWADFRIRTASMP
ncbi:hypothetical protein OG828_20980 [Streptomyces sp. NBC_00457]|nr:MULTISPECIES: hypothetical protein [unclassified Streptomyces]